MNAEQRINDLLAEVKRLATEKCAVQAYLVALCKANGVPAYVIEQDDIPADAHELLSELVRALNGNPLDTE